MSEGRGAGSGGGAQRALGALCRLVVAVFYRRCEVVGLERVPGEGPVMLCANHASALADAIIVQSVHPVPVHPLARSGLFEKPVLGRALRAQGAVPIYRRDDPGVETARNAQSFAACHAVLARGGTLLVFPEGHSHSDPFMHAPKTGAARIAIGAGAVNGRVPAIVPVGLTFTMRGRFGSSVLVQYGPPIEIPPGAGAEDPAQVRELTARIAAGIAEVTLAAETWDELDLVNRLERFFALRRGRIRRTSLRARFRAVARLRELEARVRARHPELVEAARERLIDFQRLCDELGVRDYHLTVRLTPAQAVRYASRSLVVLAFVAPLGLWGWLNSALPFHLTRHLARRLAAGDYQHDTAKMGIGAALFLAFWGAQCAAVWAWQGPWGLALYALTLPPSAAAALALRTERRRIGQRMRLAWLWVRGGELRHHLEERRAELERDLARLARASRAALRRPAPGPDA